MISGGIDEILEKDKEFFRNIQEHQLLERNLLSKVVPLVIDITTFTINKYKK